MADVDVCARYQMIQIDLDDGFKVNYAKSADVMAKVR